MGFQRPLSLISLFVTLTFTYQATAQLKFIDSCNNWMGNYTARSTYKNNLNALLINLTSNTNIDYGFFNFSYGKSPDIVNAIGLCRGDVSPQECLNCLNDSRVQLTRKCPNQKEAIGFGLACMLRYSSHSIFHIMDPQIEYYEWTGINATKVEQFNGVLMNLLNGLRSKAASGDSLHKFAAGNVTGPSFQNIYALVQCTPDLVEQDCNDCLFGAFSEITKCCSGNRAVRIGRRSCNVRFDTNRFYGPINDTTPSPHVQPNYNTPTKGHSYTLRTVIIIVVAAASLVTLFVFICIYFALKGPRKYSEGETEANVEIKIEEPLQFDFDTIEVATDSFSDANKLGEGGFGPVYKGMLFNGQEIAVKRLSKASNQGDIQFKNEVMLVARLQHRNLVKLLGFCLEKSERLLVYEFLPNKSLNYFIFDPTNHKLLNWERRYKIIEGIARGLLYLHEDSRLRIVHRDLKLSNILLDQEMNSKISDFGTARLLCEDQTQSDTSQIVGTYGYMAPEYVNYGHFSMKSDIFSFGVMVLEIVSGRKNVLSFAWKNWRADTITKIIDPSINDVSRDEIMRCIHIGLLCVQEDVADRPTMASIVLMLNSYSTTLPVPLLPTFYISGTSLSDKDSSENNSGSTTTGESRSNINQVSANEASITELSPR
ncbi:putative receptor-like protein kinase At4g00960 [Abrus precatorius]|uniref:Receptor-like protein kinase At4g00960 n=1 Tax=Abrus precatorius TaxID=3816 RepID=A0A8B8KCB8_ABRPR|nr:putative receptor-like protein kinase At4g00960 [Abrus precatorius]